MSLNEYFLTNYVQCAYMNYGSRTRCHRCRADKPGENSSSPAVFWLAGGGTTPPELSIGVTCHHRHLFPDPITFIMIDPCQSSKWKRVG